MLLRTELRAVRDVTQQRSLVTNGLDDVAGAGLALRADHRRALRDPAERLAEVPAAAYERDRERPFIDVVLLVGRRQHLGFVDVIDPEGLEDLCFDEVADPSLRHHGDRYDGLDLVDLRGIGHAGDPAFLSDVRGDPLEGHHGARAGVFGDLGLVRRGDVHDDATLEHLRQPRFHGEGARLALHAIASSSMDGSNCSRGLNPRIVDQARRKDHANYHRRLSSRGST